MVGRETYFVSRDGSTILPGSVISGVPYIDPSDRKSRPKSLEEHGQKVGVYLMNRRGTSGKKRIVVGTLPSMLAHSEEIDPGITALTALPEDDEISWPDLSVTIAPAITDVGEGDGGELAAATHVGCDVVAKVDYERPSCSHFLTHKLADSNCEACMVGAMNLRK